MNFRNERLRHELRIDREAGRRGVFRLHSRVLIPRSREEVFEFFADAHKLESITPAWLRFMVLSPPPIEMRAGTEIDYRLRLHGVPLRWRSRISVWEPSARFVDEQVRGPYRFWRHEHRFEDHDQGTLVTDEVEYAVPGGELMHRLFVGRDVRSIFAHRRQRLLEEFGAVAAPAAESVVGAGNSGAADG